MTLTITLDRPHFTRSRKAIRSVVSALTAVGAAMVRPHKAALSNLARIPLTLAGAGCIDAGVIHANLTAGLIVTGLSLLVVERIVADEQ